MPPAIITNMTPTALMAAKDTCRMMIIRFREVKKFGEIIEKKIIKPIKIISGAYFLISLPILAPKFEMLGVELFINDSP